MCAISFALLGPDTARAGPDYDGDGHVADDCAPLDPEVFPGAVDRPDLTFEDMNCDGVDGDAGRAVFVAVTGSDTNAGTRASPLRTINAGVAMATTQGEDVYVSSGTYNERVAAADGVGIYGGYQPFTVARSDATTINGAPEAILANGDQGVVLQLLALTGNVDQAGNAYALRAINGSTVALVGVTASAANAAAGTSGAGGSAGGNGGTGGTGQDGGCSAGAGGPAGSGANVGGAGGRGGFNSGSGIAGGDGAPAGPGGNGGTGGTVNALSGVGGAGGPGSPGAPGGTGGNGAQGVFSTASAAATWITAAASDGGAGTPGTGGAGGGGGGGGGGGDGIDSAGGGGGGAGGGGGGFPGGGGSGGEAGGGAFAAYLFGSSLVAHASTLTAGNGGNGGNGGPGGTGGNGGPSGVRGLATAGCGDATPGDGGLGGSGGVGGTGGPGGGGSGGPSAGIFSGGAASNFAVRPGSTLTPGAAGTGGRRDGTGAFAASGQAAAVLPLGSQGSATSDFDADGVPDITDACPEVPRGTADVNGDGCPDRRARLLDSDGDGVPDAFDTAPANPPPASTSDRPLRLADLPPPKLGKTLNAEPVGDGDVLVSVAGSARARASTTVPGLKGRNFIPLREARQVPVGSFFDTRRGRVRLQSAGQRSGTSQFGEFDAGVFQVLQSGKRGATGLTELRLKGSSFRSCTRARGRRAASAARRSRGRIRRLRGNASGRFRTRGRYSAATVRGTTWTVSDRCDGTLTEVAKGRVAVRDLRRRKTILLRAGKRYLARASG